MEKIFISASTILLHFSLSHTIFFSIFLLSIVPALGVISSIALRANFPARRNTAEWNVKWDCGMKLGNGKWETGMEQNCRDSTGGS